MDASCQSDPRRDAVRNLAGRNGLDYVEVADDRPTLHVYFLGRLPPELRKKSSGLQAFLRVDGGERIKNLNVLDVEPHVDPNPERDDYLAVSLDRRGDFSSYTLRLVGLPEVDPRYDRASFSFGMDCPSDLDCRPSGGCTAPALEDPRINYLAKDYASFRQMIFDRLALLVPEWKERHLPDLGVTLVELLAYIGDYLSYYQDAVATEAYLGTARQRISVRRHARLVDYRLHEGCNARAWVVVTTSADVDVAAGDIGFVTGLNPRPGTQQRVLTTAELDGEAGVAPVYFEPIVADRTSKLRLRAAHNEITFYTWGRRECCLAPGATSASLRDAWRADSAVESGWRRTLDIRIGDVLIFEEIVGPKTGVSSDADPRRRHAVRVTTVETTEDSLYPVPVGVSAEPRPAAKAVGPGSQSDSRRYLATPVVEIAWAPEDALPFALCLSTIGPAPICAYLTNVSVARGNVILVDHGRTVEDPELGAVPALPPRACCECEGEASDTTSTAGRYRPTLRRASLTFREEQAVDALPAARALSQDARAALPAIDLKDRTNSLWSAAPDLLNAGPDDRRFVVEIDNDAIAHLRFGDGELGRAPAAGASFRAEYRIGLGARGNVGAESISRMILKKPMTSGASFRVRNPFAATGGTQPETIEEAKLFAPRAFRKQLQRAITADDYAQLAGGDPALQRAAAELAWTGSWYEAEVSIDPWGRGEPDAALVDRIAGALRRYRRMGHDLRVRPAALIPIKVGLQICVRAGYDRGHVRAALLERFCRRPGATGTGAFFDPDQLSFGEGIFLSRIVAAAQAVPGVECATVSELHRLFEPSNRELETGVLAVGAHEIAQLENDRNHPERGQLVIDLRGGR